MPTPAPNLDELFKWEQHLERGAVLLLENAGLPVPFVSRSGRQSNSPYVSLYAQIGTIVGDHQFIFPDGIRKCFDVFGATLTTEVVTNRGTEIEQTPDAHTELLGKLRKALQFFRIVQRWDAENYLIIVDIREGGTVDTWADEDQLDHSTITWNLVFNVAPWAWPLDLDAD